MNSMNIDEFKYLWESEKDDWVLVNTEYGYGIVNKRTQMALLISDDDLEGTVIQRMISEGNNIYDNINDAYADV